jgi:hypothetical protein
MRNDNGKPDVVREEGETGTMGMNYGGWGLKRE